MAEHWFLRHKVDWENLIRELSSLTKDYPIAEEILERLKAGNGVLYEGVRYPQAGIGGRIQILRWPLFPFVTLGRCQGRHGRTYW